MQKEVRKAMRHIFIINPLAGKTDASERIRRSIEAVCEKYGIEPLICISEHEGYEREMTAKMISFFSNEMIRIYAVGGSGSLLNVISGITDFNSCEVAFCPVGLTNGILRSFEPAEAFSSVDALVTGNSRKLDLLELSNGLCVPNCISIGAGSTINRETPLMEIAAFIKPSLPYRISVLSDLILNKRYSCTITANGVDYSGNYILAACFNGRCLGGDISPVRNAVPDDGIMDVLLAEEMPFADRKRLFSSFADISPGKTGQRIHMIRTAKLDVTVNDSKPFFLNCDGEAIPMERNSFSVRLLPGKLKFVVPSGVKISCI